MKSYMNQLIVLFIAAILFYGCDNWIEGYDDDPNSSPEASIDNLFTASQVNVFNFSESNKSDDAQFKIILCYINLNDYAAASRELSKLKSNFSNSEYIVKANNLLNKSIK